MPAPLEGGRFLHLVVAAPGWSAWFKSEDGKRASQPVACWGVVENEKADARNFKVVARTQDVVPVICGGAAGLVDATIPDEDVGDFMGVTGPGETVARIERLFAIDEEEFERSEGEDAKPVTTLKAVPNNPVSVLGATSMSDAKKAALEMVEAADTVEGAPA